MRHVSKLFIQDNEITLKNQLWYELLTLIWRLSLVRSDDTHLVKQWMREQCGPNSQRRVRPLGRYWHRRGCRWWCPKSEGTQPGPQGSGRCIWVPWSKWQSRQAAGGWWGQRKPWQGPGCARAPFRSLRQSPRPHRSEKDQTDSWYDLAVEVGT